MNIDAYRKVVVPVMRKRHKDLEGTDVTEIVEDTFGGTLVAVRSNNKVEHEEIVFVHPDHTVRLFGTTEELIHFLDDQSKRTWFDKLFTRSVLSGVVFLGLLIVIAIAGAMGTFYNDTVLAILGNVISVAAGFFFGSHKQAEH